MRPTLAAVAREIILTLGTVPRALSREGKYAIASGGAAGSIGR